MRITVLSEYPKTGYLFCVQRGVLGNKEKRNGKKMNIKRLRNPPDRNLKANILYRLDTNGKTDKEKLEIVEEIREILRKRIKEKKASFG